MIDLTIEAASALICAAFIAGFVDAIAGGGGLITVPALLLAGASPLEALATNKVQGSFGAATAALTYAGRGLVNLQAQMPLALLAVATAFGGAMLAGTLPADLMRRGLPVLLVAVALFFALKPGLEDRPRTAVAHASGLLFVPAIALYDGLIGPGAGAFYMSGFVLLAGYGLLQATAHTKFLNFASNIGGLAAFALMGAPLWGIGVMMGLAQMVGARVGAGLAIRLGARLIRPLLVLAALALAARLLWDA